MRRRRLEVTSPKSVLVPGHLSALDASAGASPSHACCSSDPETRPLPLTRCQPPPAPGSVLPAVPSPEPGRTEPGRARPPQRGRSPWRPSSRRRLWTVSSGPGSWIPGSGAPAAARRCPRGWAQLGRPTGDRGCLTPAPQPHLGGLSSRWHSPHPRFLLRSLSPPFQRDCEPSEEAEQRWLSGVVRLGDLMDVLLLSPACLLLLPWGHPTS